MASLCSKSDSSTSPTESWSHNSTTEGNAVGDEKEEAAEAEVLDSREELREGVDHWVDDWVGVDERVGVVEHRMGITRAVEQDRSNRRLESGGMVGARATPPSNPASWDDPERRERRLRVGEESITIRF